MNRLTSTLTAIVLGGVTIVACDRPNANPAKVVSQALKGVLVYPRSSLSSMSAGDSAGQLVLSSPDAPDVVAKWFRLELPLNHWDVQGDIRQPDSTIAIYAERAKQPLWITIHPNVGSSGTSYTVTGAIVGSGDSTTATPATSPIDSAAQRSGSNKSSNRIHRR